MSLMNRPRVVVNGVRRMRTFHYFWCQACQRTVRIASANPNAHTCPFCFNRLRFELDISRSRLIMDLPNNLEPSSAAQLMNSLALILDPSMRRRNTHFNRTFQWETEDEDGPGSGSWITLRFVRPNRPPGAIAQPENVAPQANDTRVATPFEDASDDFVEGLVQNNRQGPPPEAVSAIEALPLVKVTQTHLASDPNCPICKDEFQLDMEVRELPCKHFYHSDCIVPWLRIQNTCPICRHQLQPTSNYHFQNQIEENYVPLPLPFGEVTNSLNWFWSQLVSLRPLRAVLDWTQRQYHDFQENQTPRDGAWWRSWLVL
ncbi:hypothetical protein L6164_036230 [Bauhinia variegata]|uniref:Uncharacterized protein n=1 Tax=Bauhinia variegata TaxID=167791 RepID=A0ACB9KGF0_BAUVA|nr:hypothetical protein L6164_036230 [Bauhinia variegata]